MSKLARRFGVATITWGLTLAAFSTQNTALAAEPSGGKHFLWRVTNAPQLFYLVGGMRALASNEVPPDAIEKAAGQCQNFTLQIDPNAWGSFQSQVFSISRYPYGQTIESKVKPQTLAYLKSMFAKSGVNFNRYHTLRPWAIAGSMLKAPGFDSANQLGGVADYILREARLRNKRIGGLESPAFSLGLLKGLTDEESEVILLAALIRLDKTAALRAAEVAAWRRGDAEGELRVEEEEGRDLGHLFDRVLYDRTAKWLPQIERQIHSGTPSMVLVGSAHFGGRRGLLALLRARGYKLEQL